MLGMIKTLSLLTEEARPAANAHALGPQCLNCRKRRVKCDSNKPTCLRCPKDKLQCRGYTKELKIIPYQASTCSKRSCHGSHKKTDALENNIFHPMSQDSDELVMLDTIYCYNRYIVPDSAPAHRPFKRREVVVDTPWEVVPKVIWYLFIVAFKTQLATRNNLDPNCRQDVCHYRGLSLHELKQYLPKATTDPSGIALSSILMLLAADMHSPTTWDWHLRAARRIITVKGGTQRCLHSIPYLESPLINYIVIDIFTATTCRSKSLLTETQTLAQHIEYLNQLPNLEMRLLEHACCCPLPILQAIIRATILRMHHAKQSSPDTTTTISDLSEHREIIESLNTFDPATWITKILQHNIPLPLKSQDIPSKSTISSFTSLANCYTAACQIYLLLSTAPSLAPEHNETIRNAKENIDTQTHHLFGLASSDPEAPVHRRLWKFVSWPMVMAAYAHVGWDFRGTCASVEAELERLSASAVALGSVRLSGAVRYLRHVRMKREETGEGRAWRWDDGFEGRCAFGV